MADTWYLDIETELFSIVKHKTTSALQTKYPNIVVTMNDTVPTEPKFPTVYIHFMPSIERGRDLEGSHVSAILASIQIDVTVSKEQGMNACREVMGTVTDIFKGLRFEINSFPEFSNQSEDTKRLVCRCRRVIGCGETW